MIAEIHVLPSPPGTSEGGPDEVWPLLRRVHEACLGAGADGVVTVVKVAEVAAGTEPLGIDDLVGKFR